VKLLVDQNLSPVVAELLRAGGHDATHVRDLGLSRASDPVILERAAQTGAVVLSADTDFGTLLAASGATAPSVVLVRRSGNRHAVEVAALVLANLDAVSADLDAGAIVVLEQRRLRIRALPLS
jgi:predicted nuclease of predicted toxin-antitoxin system